MPSVSTIAIIYNPNSTGDAKDNALHLKAGLLKADSKRQVKLLPTKYAGHAEELAYEFAKREKTPLIVAASGDGGYHEVINGALRAQEEGSSPVCAVLPSGNANDHARTMQEKPLLDLIKKNSVSSLDVMRIEVTDETGKTIRRYAHSYIGLGLTPTVAVELNKHTLNSFREALIVIKTFWNLRPVVLEIDGRVRKFDSFICSIIPEMAKVLTFSEEARPDDGKFELTTFKHKKKVYLLFRLIKGIFKSLGVNSQLKTFECTVLRPAPIQLDGEVMKLSGKTRLKVVACPGLLKTFV